MEKLYKRLFTQEDVLSNFGYDLMAIANKGGFSTLEAACEAWCDEAALAIHNLISRNRGQNYTKSLYDYVLEKDEAGEPLHIDEYTALAWAQLYQMQFIIENGNLDIQANEAPKRYSNDAVNCLYNVGILIYGM